MTKTQKPAAATSPKFWTLGDKVRLPDGPYGEITAIEPGIEYGDPVLYVTVNGQTRWVRV